MRAITVTTPDGWGQVYWRQLARAYFPRGYVIHTSDPAAPEDQLSAESDDLREHFEERAGILEYDAGLPRHEAELEAAKITATYARNRGYQWTSLRSALSAYPELLAFVGAHEVVN